MLAQAKTERGRHIVLASMRARHRLVITHSAERDGYFVPKDHSIPIRLAALGAFHDLRSRQTVGSPAALKPTAYQRRRLALLLAILDRLEQSATVRQIAHELVLPGLGYERAIEWKTSSHRRQAQRLIAEARRMMAIGYRDLLRGSMRPALFSEPGDDRDFDDNGADGSRGRRL
jgi:hypothetical protein